MENIFKGVKVREGDVIDYIPNTIYFILKADGTFDIEATDNLGAPKPLSQRELEELDLMDIEDGTSDDGLLVSAGTLNTYRQLGKGILEGTSKSAEHVLTTEDVGKTIYTTQQVNIPSARLPIGAVVTIVNTNDEPIVVGLFAGVTLRLAGTLEEGWATIPVGSMATLRQVSEDVWYIQGASGVLEEVSPIAKRRNTDNTGWTYYATSAAEAGRVYEYEGETFFTVADAEELHSTLQSAIEGLSGEVTVTDSITQSAATIPVNNLITTYVTDFTDMFRNGSDDSLFNYPVDKWDTSRVTSFNSTFYRNVAFNQPVGGWDTGSCRDFEAVFGHASAYNQPLGGWDTKQGTTFAAMFLEATLFNQSLDHFNFQEAVSMNSFMLAGGSTPLTYSQPLNIFYLPKARNINGMLQGLYNYVGSIDNLYAPEAEDPNNIFYALLPVGNGGNNNGRNTFNATVANWFIPRIKDLSHLFHNFPEFNQPLTGWDTAHVTKMEGMFWQASSFNQDLTHFDMRKVENAFMMFAESGMKGDLSGWRFESLDPTVSGGPLGRMFISSPQNTDSPNPTVDDWSFGQGSGTVEYLFYGATAFNKPVNSWDVTFVEWYGGAFSDARHFNQPVDNWNTCRAKDMGSMFTGAFDFDQDLSSWRVPLIPEDPGIWHSWPIPAGRMPRWGMSCSNAPWPEEGIGDAFYVGEYTIPEGTGAGTYSLFIAGASGENRAPWKVENSDTPNTDSLYDGASNTWAMDTAEGPVHPAAMVVKYFTSALAGSWYLPSIEELKFIQSNPDPKFGLEEGLYWSSTQGLDGKAQTLDLLGTGDAVLVDKNNGSIGIRPVARVKQYTPPPSPGTENNPQCKPRKSNLLGTHKVPSSSVKPGVSGRALKDQKKINIC